MLPPGSYRRTSIRTSASSCAWSGSRSQLTSDPGWAPSSAFYDRYGTRMPGFVNEFVTMRGGQADLPRLTADVSRIVGQPVNVESTQDLDGLRKAKDVTGVERQGLLLFALAVVIGGGVLVGQALVRAVTAGAAELPTWQAMGADTPTVVPALVLPAFVTAGVAAVTSVVTALALSSRFPLGLGRTYDLDVGVHADWPVLLGAALSVAVGVVVTALLAAVWRTTRGASVRARPGASWALVGPGRSSARARRGFPPRGRAGSRPSCRAGSIRARRCDRRCTRSRRVPHVPVRSRRRGYEPGPFGCRVGLRHRVGRWAAPLRRT